MNTLTNERLNTIASWRKTYGDAHNVMIPAHEAEELVSRLLAAEKHLAEIGINQNRGWQEAHCAKLRAESAEAQLAELRGQKGIVAWQSKGEPWKIILDRDIEEVRKTSGSWLPLSVVTVPPAASQQVAWRWFDGRGYNSTTDKRRADELVKDGVPVEALALIQPNREQLRHLVDVVWNAVTESEEVPSTEWADELIDKAFSDLPASQPYTVPDDVQFREAFEKWCPVNIERNKWHPEFYAHLPAREQWDAWNACRAAMLQSGNSQETNGSREHFISLCNEFWNWQEFDEINADEEEPRLEWDGEKFTHRVTQALWRIYQAAPGNSPVVPIRYMNRYTGACFTLEQQPDAATDTDVYIPLVPMREQ